MKKIFALIVMMIFMFSVGTMAYAAPNTADTIKAKKETIEQKRQEMQAEKLKSKGAVVATDTLNAKKEAVQKRQELKAYLQTISNQIKTNRAEILQLKAEARIAQKAAAAHIKELKKSPDKLTEAQIAKLQDAKVTLKKSRTELAKSVGEIKNDKALLKAAKKGQDSAQMKAALEKITATQKERVTILKGIIEDLKKIAAI